jgi:hypothetical protein
LGLIDPQSEEELIRKAETISQKKKVSVEHLKKLFKLIALIKGYTDSLVKNLPAFDSNESFISAPEL